MCKLFIRLLAAIAFTVGFTSLAVGQGSVQNPHGRLSIACQNCHTTTSFSPIRAVPEFNHNSQTHYPLRGLHVNVACNSCHVSRVFTAAGTQCADCHADFHRRQFGAQCENCHTVQGWQRATKPIQEHMNRFPLLGAHATVECDSCHKGAAVGNYVGLSTQCASCHLKDYTAAKIVNHQAARFPTQCDTCHNLNGWLVTRFDHARFTGFALVGAHTNLACELCHTGGKFQGVPTDCYSCHAKDYNAATNPNHVAAGFSHDCTACHTNSLNWLNATFNHNLTKFPLTGKHATTDCVLCHVNNNFTALSTACNSCHLKDYQGTSDPAHAAAGFSQDCQLCHSTTNWTGATFNHNTTKFPLTGKHTAVACATCHVNNQFATLPANCDSCHLKDYQGATSPNHAAAGFPLDCGLCHATTDWLSATFNHNTTKFPLTGKHTGVACATCHVNNQFATLPTNCDSCHLKEYQGTTNPNHVASAFPLNCSLCHSTVDWTGATFNHNATKFPLTGKHTTVACATCHVNNQYATLPTNCDSCHLKEYQGTTNPNHLASAFPLNCSLCHSTVDWTGATFNHNATKFPLTGKHTTVACATCHVNNQYATLPTNCDSCHLKEYQATTNPGHAAAGFALNCALCHSTTDWLGATFNHSATKFPLTGKHTTVACASCHVNNQFATLPTNCDSCHLKEYQATTNPNHVSAAFPKDCALCHSTTDWLSATFNHNTTKFPLTGKHTAVACATCHVNNQYATLPTNCDSCHLKESQATTNPAHAAAGFALNCALCHTTTDWLSASFNHSTTKFPLTGKHTSTTCAACHTVNPYSAQSTACYSCHIKDYQGTSNPNHVTAGFPQDCALCHSTTDWTGATFDHSKTKFPLTGKHTTVACATCHVNNQYATLPVNCDSCHLATYNATTNPNHVAAGFPKDCSLCHSTADWTSATFDHSKTKFPLTGKHTTVTCTTCHVNNQYATLPTSCDSCHLAAYNGTTTPAHLALGYPKDCSLCHSTTNWTSSTFNHNNVGFTLSGKHLTIACLSCHVGGKFPGTPTDCYACHSTEYASTTNPAHASAVNTQFFPHNCATCHTTNVWSGGTFVHTSLPATQGGTFPVTHGRAAGVCTTCHLNGADYSQPNCKTCHSAAATNPHHTGVRNYNYANPDINCYSCHRSAAGGG